jgi:DNA polymerase
MKDWLSGKSIETESLDKKAVRELLPDADEDVADVLACRQQLAKASVSNKMKKSPLAQC